jgi:plasmid stability protein
MRFGAAMASITIRNLDEETKRRLRIRAAKHGRSMEEEARRILHEGVGTATPTPGLAETGGDLQTGTALPPDKGLGTFIHELFQPLGGVELELPTRRSRREPPDFSGPEFGK